MLALLILKVKKYGLKQKHIQIRALSNNLFCQELKAEEIFQDIATYSRKHSHCNRLLEIF